LSIPQPVLLSLRPPGQHADDRVVRLLEVLIPPSESPSRIEVECLVPADAADRVQVRIFRVS
jgi:hypothetical protein